jgi:hypothetical protein
LVDSHATYQERWRFAEQPTELRWPRNSSAKRISQTLAESGDNSQSGADSEIGTCPETGIQETCHPAMEGKRRALDQIAARQRAATDEKRHHEIERQQQAAMVPQFSGGSVITRGCLAPDADHRALVYLNRLAVFSQLAIHSFLLSAAWKTGATLAISETKRCATRFISNFSTS